MSTEEIERPKTGRKQKTASYDQEFNSVSVKFDQDIDRLENGTLPKGYVFDLGLPSITLIRTGFNSNHRIELTLSQLKKKMNNINHPFRALEIKGLVNSLAKPIAVFAYGDRKKAQNVIVDLSKDDKHFLLGIHFNKSVRGSVTVSDIRGIFAKDDYEWLNWFDKQLGLFVDKNKIQAIITQQRINPAEVDYLNLDSIERIIDEDFDVNGFSMN